MTLRQAVLSDAENLNRLWRTVYPRRFWIETDLLADHTLLHPLFLPSASYVATEGERITAFCLVKKNGYGLYPGPVPDDAHLSAVAFRNPAAASECLKMARSALGDFKQLRFGQDSGHLWPGAPTTCSLLTQWLASEGFDFGGGIFDCEQDLADYTPPPGPPAIRVGLLRPPEIPKLDDFFLREFPGRWRYDVMAKVAANGPSCVVVLRDGSKIEGFALIQDETTGPQIGGAVWNLALGKNWCSLGPIGISKHLRGAKRGDALLAAALMELKGRGRRNCIIDWTTLKKFYGGHGFRSSRQYLSASLHL
ncbi:MAG: hypothetical protein JSS72_12950 [Armatimonadetes bacterium]|nr:hypothetical protein [Armatimonadota bacterium]